MKYVYFFLAGAVAGIAGGMGMGGGTLLIPMLTLIGGVPQKAAQAINLVSFVPMAAVALVFHIRKGLVDFRDILYVILPGAAFSAAFSYIGENLDGSVLKRVFGGFLIFLAVAQIFVIKLSKRQGNRDSRRKIR